MARDLLGRFGNGSHCGSWQFIWRGSGVKKARLPRFLILNTPPKLPKDFCASASLILCGFQRINKEDALFF